MVQYHEKGESSVEDRMSEDARYFWCLQNIARAAALQELDSLPTADLKETMAQMAAFKLSIPRKPSVSIGKYRSS